MVAPRDNSSQPNRETDSHVLNTSVDAQTEATMQSIIETEFQHATIISVLHRFTYIHRYDRIAVLQRGGHLVEFDAPGVLLARDGSFFEELYRGHACRPGR